MQGDVGGGVIAQDVKERLERAIDQARKIGHARQQERDRIAGEIEQLLHEARTTETCDMLVRLAREVYLGAKP